MRIDKFLKVSMLLKRRSVGKSACDKGRIKINGVSAKPCKEVNVGDVIEIGFGSGAVKVKVIRIAEFLRKGDEPLYEVISE